MNSPEPLTSQVLDLTRTSCADWDDLVLRCPSIHLEQTTAWAEARRVDGWNPRLLVVRRGNRVVAGALTLIRRQGRWVRVGYVSRGPIVSDPDSNDASGTERFVIRELQKLAREASISCLVVDPPYYSNDLPGQMRTWGFTPHLAQLPPKGLTKGALLIDLKSDEQTLLSNMRRSTRSVIRKAGESHLVVRRGGRDDIPTLWNLLRQLCDRRGTRSNVSKIEFFHVLWDRLEPSGQVRMDVVESKSVPIAALMTVQLASWAIPWRIGWSGDEARLSPEKFLYWQVIRDLKRSGAITYDFNWIDPDEAENIKKGGELSDPSSGGITNYKIGFGGDVIRISPPMDYFPHPIVRLAMKWGGSQLLNSPQVARRLSQIAGKGGRSPG